MKIFVLFLSLIVSLFCLEIEAGKEYSGPVLLKGLAEGVSFTLPKGWVAYLNEDSALTASRDNEQIISIITPYTFDSDMVMNEMNEVQDMGDGIFLHPISKARKVSSSIYEADYTLHGTQEPMLSRIYVVVFSKGKALIFIGASLEKNVKLMQADLFKMAKSAGSFKVEVPKKK